MRKKNKELVFCITCFFKVSLYSKQLQKSPFQWHSSTNRGRCTATTQAVCPVSRAVFSGLGCVFHERYTFQMLNKGLTLTFTCVKKKKKIKHQLGVRDRGREREREGGVFTCNSSFRVKKKQKTVARGTSGAQFFQTFLRSVT